MVGKSWSSPTREKLLLKTIFLKENRILIKFVRSIQQKVGIEFPSIYKLLKRFHEGNAMDRRGSLGRRQTINTSKIGNLIVNWICSEEDNPGSHMSPRELKKNQRYKPYVIRRMIKRRGWMHFKRLKTTIISSGTQERRTKRAGVLADRFRKIRSVKKMCPWNLKQALNHGLVLKKKFIESFSLIKKLR